MDNAPVPRQRSPWFYVLLGCGGLAGLMCLGLGGSGLYCAKQVSDISQGVTDPRERQKNALEQLGALPEGYSVVASFSLPMGLMKQTMLSDRPLLPDGGVPVGGRQFTYLRVMANERNKRDRAFLDGSDPQGTGLGEGGLLRLDPKTVIRRGQLQVDGRKLSYLVARLGEAGVAGIPMQAFASIISFDCPDEVLRVGYWTQQDPAPEVKPEALVLEGTVADEAQLAGFLKPMNPCGR
jgi:hypothetical protein